jgi:exodeoxyribonuclease V alpha subunit
MHLALGLKENAPYTSARLPSSTEIVVVDELSTVGVYLFACLCFAISLLERPPRLLLLGDDNQLESIEPGAVLSTLLQTSLPRTNLLTDHRGDAKFTAVAQNCLTGTLDLDNAALNVMFGSAHELLEQFQDLCNRIPAYHGIDLINDYQILAPIYSGDIGIERLNLLIQQRVNKQASLPNNPDLKIGD